jgi:hypothetical protein
LWKITFAHFHLMKSTLPSSFVSFVLACFLTQGNLAAQKPQSAIAAKTLAGAAAGGEDGGCVRESDPKNQHCGCLV